MTQQSLFPDDENPYIIENFSADNVCIDIERKKLEEKYKSLLVITDNFNRKSVSYQLSKKDTLHSWLKYKEGFSADLVNKLINEFKIKPGDTIMDPFMGSGTTALVSQMRGIKSMGYDIMPISEVAINVKSRVLDYNIDELQKMLSDIRNLEIPDSFVEKTPSISITEYAYPEYNARFLEYVKQWQNKANYSIMAKDLLTLCILNSLEESSYTIKGGQYLGWDYRSPKVIEGNNKRILNGKKPFPTKIVRPEIANVKTSIISELEHVINDISFIQNNNVEEERPSILFKPNSVLYELPLLSKNIIKGVITSPPYCNRYDYTRTYALELVYLGVSDTELKSMRQNLLTCTVENHPKLDKLRDFYNECGLLDRYNNILDTIKSNPVFKEVMEALNARSERGDLNNKGVIRMVEGYFTELGFVFAELFRVCKRGASVAFVNDNVRYGGEIIPVDFLSSSLAESFGFKIKKIYCLKQQKGNSSQQMAKFGRVALRKGITVWTKE